MSDRIADAGNKTTDLARRPTLKPGDPGSLPYQSDYQRDKAENLTSAASAQSAPPKATHINWPMEAARIIRTINDSKEQGEALEAMLKKLPPHLSKNLEQIRAVISRMKQAVANQKEKEKQGPASTAAAAPRASGYSPRNPKLYQQTFKDITTAIVRSKDAKTALRNANAVISRSNLSQEDQGNLSSNLPKLLERYAPAKPLG